MLGFLLSAALMFANPSDLMRMARIVPQHEGGATP
jgi:hypothetical protein